jgi:hypothetical protein
MSCMATTTHTMVVELSHEVIVSFMRWLFHVALHETTYGIADLYQCTCPNADAGCTENSCHMSPRSCSFSWRSRGLGRTSARRHTHTNISQHDELHSSKYTCCVFFGQRALMRDAGCRENSCHMSPRSCSFSWRSRGLGRTSAWRHTHTNISQHDALHSSKYTCRVFFGQRGARPCG